VAAEAVSTVIPFGGILVAAIIAISTFGTIGIYTLSAPRIYYAMASDGLFFKGIAKVHPKFRTPVNAILVQSGWAIVLLLFWGTFENLITYTVAIEFIFYILAASGIFIFRKRMKNAERPYRTLGYPVTPFLFIAINTWFVINISINRPLHMGIGLAFLVMGVPVYHFFRKKYNVRQEKSADPEKIERDIED
jgi:APA family basic amino acid/polyamine antiporter